MVALALTALLALLVLLQVIRELWAFRRLARIDDFRAEAAAVHAAADREAALRLARRLAGFYAGRPELRWNRERLAEQEDAVLDADALLELAERSLLAPLDARARREIEVASRIVAAATAIVPLALIDVLTALSQNVRMVRRIAEVYGAHAGFFGSWRLLRMVATHLLATGAVAVGDDLIGSVAGGHVLARHLAPLRRGRRQRRADRAGRDRGDGRLPPAALRGAAAAEGLERHRPVADRALRKKPD